MATKRTRLKIDNVQKQAFSAAANSHLFPALLTLPQRSTPSLGGIAFIWRRGLADMSDKRVRKETCEHSQRRQSQTRQK